MKNGGVVQTIKDNWAIILTIVSIIVAWTSMDAKVDANAKDVSEVRSLVERVIILEEHDGDIREDIKEIKQELKEIKLLVR